MITSLIILAGNDFNDANAAAKSADSACGTR
jgi:hypothetical protein